MTTAVATESSYKSFMKPVKFWQRSSRQNNKESIIDEPVSSKDYQSQPTQEEEVEEEEEQQKVNKKSGSYMPSFGFSRKSTNSSLPPPTPIIALAESGKTEVYKLSTINDAGAYIPPSPTLQGKRDHWIDVNEDIMNFRLPSSECLTTHVGDKKKHDFFTPSTFVQTQPYIFPIAASHHMSDSTLSTVPSLFEEEDTSSDSMTNSCRSSASYL